MRYLIIFLVLCTTAYADEIVIYHGPDGSFEGNKMTSSDTTTYHGEDGSYLGSEQVED